MEHGARPPYCEPCGYKHSWSDEQIRWYDEQLVKAHGDGHPYQAYRCPAGNGWHLHSKDDDMRVAAGYTVPPAPGRRLGGG